MRCPRCFTCPIKTGKNRNCRFYILNVWILPANFGIILSLVCRFHSQSFVQYGSLVYENILLITSITHKNNWSKFLLDIQGTIKFDWNILAQTPEKVSLKIFAYIGLSLSLRATVKSHYTLTSGTENKSHYTLTFVFCQSKKSLINLILV